MTRHLSLHQCQTVQGSEQKEVRLPLSQETLALPQDTICDYLLETAREEWPSRARQKPGRNCFREAMGKAAWTD